MIRFAACAATLALAVSITGCSGSDTPECAPGQYYDQNMQMCMNAGGGQQCPPGQMWNGAQCVPGGATGGQCPAGTSWNGAQCVPMSGGQCPAGQTWDGAQCVPAAGPQPNAGGACQVQNIGGAGGPLADQAIKAIASQHIPPGSSAVGAAVVGNFQAGQCMEVPLNVEAGRCYTVVGASVGTVSDLDLELVPNIGIPGLPQQVVAQDQSDGPTAVIGAKPDCWTAFVPGPMKLIIRVANGQGMAGAQVYAK